MVTVVVCVLLSMVAVASAASVLVDFSRHLRPWDGFGVNYVQARHTRDYSVFDQDYSGFKYLDEEDRQQVIELVFGADGLKPAIVKVFCDSFHEPENDNDDPYDIDMSRFDHEKTTKWIRYFAREGLKTTRSWGGDLVFLAGLYGPPGWMTKQGVLRGRDLRPEMMPEVAEYIASWAKYLREVEGLPVKYVSPHNEGEARKRWPADGGDAPEHYAHDYNMWWPDHQVVEFLKQARRVLDAHGLQDVGLTCGETATWQHLHKYLLRDGAVMRYARRIAENPVALGNLALITSHGFGRQYDPAGIDLLRDARHGLRAWTTSYTWGDMSLDIVEEARRLIYEVKCNALIPWATLHHDYESDKLSPPAKYRKSGNANSPFKTNDGQIEVTKAYYHFKQICRAGQPGMAVAAVESDDRDLTLIAFACNGTKNADTVVVINKSEQSKPVELELRGGSWSRIEAFTTTDVDYGDRNYEPAEGIELMSGRLKYEAPPRSATTFYCR